MPSKTPDLGMNRFDMRTGLNGISTLGGMFRSGDPGVIPQHKHHLLVNMRITPSGMVSRPGLSQVFDTNVAECIDGLTGESQEISSLMLWPGSAAEYNVTVPGTGGALQAAFNAMTFRIVFPGGGDETYSEYVAVLEGLPEATNVLSPVLLANPFLWKGRLHYWTGTGGADLYSINLPSRTQEQAALCQTWPGADPADYDQRPDVYESGQYGCDRYPILDFLQPFPRDYPVGSVDKVYSILDPFTAPEVFANMVGFIVLPLRRDAKLAGTAGVREVLYVAVQGDAGTLKVLEYDGEYQRTSFTKTLTLGGNIALAPGLTGPVVFWQDGADTLPGGAYLGDDGAWHEYSSPLFWVPDDDDPPDPAIFTELKGFWAPPLAVSIMSSRTQCFVQGTIEIDPIGSPGAVTRVVWIMEESDDRTGFNRVVGQFSTTCQTGAHCVDCDAYGQPVGLGNKFFMWSGKHLADTQCVWGLLSATYQPTGSAHDTFEAGLAWTPPTTPPAEGDVDPKWVGVAANVLYVGGDFAGRHRVYQPFGVGLVFDGPTSGGGTPGTYVSQGCLAILPGHDTGEGFGAEQEPFFA